MDKKFHPTVYDGCNYLPMLGLKINHVSKRGPWGSIIGHPYSRLFIKHMACALFYFVVVW